MKNSEKSNHDAPLIRSGDAAPQARLWQALEQGLASQHAAFPSWMAGADSAAARFLGGGRLWAGGPFPDFAGEACNRAGGLMPIAPLSSAAPTPGVRPQAGDVALLGFLAAQPSDTTRVEKLQGLGLLVMGFGARSAHPEAAARCDFWVDAEAPQIVAGAPAAGILTISALWAFTGEFITACLRAGQMPTVWQSIMMPGSRERNARYRPLRVHADMFPTSPSAGQVAGAYLDSLQLYLRQFRSSQWERLQQAGYLVRAVRQIGRTPRVCPLGRHLRPNLMDLPGTTPDLVDVSRYVEPAPLRAMLKQGDMVYFQGYTDPPADLLDATAAAGAFTVLSLAGRDGQPPDPHTADVVLDAQWELGDATVTLSGYDVPLLPPSGFTGAAIYWALVLASQPWPPEEGVPGP